MKYDNQGDLSIISVEIRKPEVTSVTIPSVKKLFEVKHLPHVGHVTERILRVDFLLTRTGGAVMKNLAMRPLLEAILPGCAARNKLYFFPFFRSMA